MVSVSAHTCFQRSSAASAAAPSCQRDGAAMGWLGRRMPCGWKIAEPCLSVKNQKKSRHVSSKRTQYVDLFSVRSLS
jgi:hypothetical protein